MAVGFPKSAAEFAAVNSNDKLGHKLGERAYDENGYTYVFCKVATGITLAATQLVYHTRTAPYTVTTDYSEVEPQDAMGVAKGAGTASYYVWVLDIHQPALTTIKAASSLACASSYPVVVSSTDGTVTAPATALVASAKRIGWCYSAKISGTTVINVRTPFNVL